MSWALHCAWCLYYILVGDRGMRGGDPGAGVEAADLMKEHIEREHQKTWAEFRAKEPVG
jgi:hypothetical protein